MCRIVGGISFNERDFDLSVITRMRDVLAHGGPDSAGLFNDRRVFLAHRRLSIIDVGDSGLQPMTVDGYVITYNGEIYNFREIRLELEKLGCCFRTSGDTEVIVRAMEYWGSGAVKRFRGMFAFAIWDTDKKILTLCRDRFGVKPLFVYHKDDLLLFASELKSFHEHPKFDKEVDLNGIPHFLLKGYFLEEHCIFKFVRKLKPGTLMTISISGVITETVYWDIHERLLNHKTGSLSYLDAKSHLKNILTSSFKLRMISDVPVGIFLSGGIDSSLVAAILQESSNKTLSSFTIGFEESSFDESQVAIEIARRLGTSHETVICSQEDFLDVIPKLPYVYDEPFGDSSAIPTFLLAEFASKKVKVALSGDGADELFGGYSKYRFMKQNNLFLMTPLFARKALQSFSYVLGPEFFQVFAKFGPFNEYTQFSSKFRKFRQVIGASSKSEMFDFSSSYLSDDELNWISNNYFKRKVPLLSDLRNERLVTSMGYSDINSYLVGDVLTKVDRASMHNALEAREPFLDPEILDFSFAMNDDMKITRDGTTKSILRNLLADYLPKDILNRPKHGFSVPIDDWMRSNLKEEFIDIIEDDDFFEKFHLNQQVLRVEFYNFFTTSSKLNPHVYWFIYSLYKWYKHWIKK